ncbi:helix-turn-helix domain-containing protein [Candidatus Omnitrophota bacterium]
MNKRFISIQGLAQYIGVSVKTVRYWLLMRQIPYHKFGRSVRFDLQELEGWFQEHKISESS